MNPQSRLKVKGDTAYLPDGEGGVYFRNNSGSFSMTGSMMDRWIEKLFPVFNGEHTMQELTEDLQDPHRNRVYEIAQSLVHNGFARDVSEDPPHRLPDPVLAKFAAQIEFLDNLEGAGAYRFQEYREGKVLAVGDGAFGVSLAAALLESGLTRFHLALLEATPEHRQRVFALAEHARMADAQTAIEELAVPMQDPVPWRALTAPFDWILYASEEAGLETFRALHQVCVEQRKVLLPAMFIGQTGVAGPLVSPDSEGCWESAWRRLHRAAIGKDPAIHTVSSTAQSMLANIITFELFKSVTGVSSVELQNQVYLLNLETLEGSRHPFVPHPHVTGMPEMKKVASLEGLREARSHDTNSNGLLAGFARFTSPETGILHLWDEGELRQLPVSMCHVQAVDPLADGPCDLLQETVCGGFTHEEARREAGLAGIEAYAARLNQTSSGVLSHVIGVGTGETVYEAVCRGLQHRLMLELGRQLTVRRPVLFPVRLEDVQDERTRFYIMSLTTLRGQPLIAAGEDVIGFPSMWVRTGDCWYGSVGLNPTSSVRNALLMALMKTQNDSSINCGIRALEASSVILADYGTPRLAIPTVAEPYTSTDWQAAVRIMGRKGKQAVLYELGIEPVIKEELSGVFGVSLREEGSP